MIITSFDDFLSILDVITTSAPEFYKANINGVTIGEPIGVPLLLILDLVSNTTAAYSLFIEPTFNGALRDLLNAWGAFLKAPASSETLTTDQWWSEAGMAALTSGLGGASFDDTFQLDMPPPQRYNSWDSFFTRQFKDPAKSRPVIKGTVPYLYNACESTVLRTIRNVQLHDTFWLKNQNYSLYDVFGGNDPKSTVAQYAEQFVGASIYQAFLSPADYHRWHSPVDGDIVAAQVLEGTYYAVLPDDGAPFWDTDLVPGDPHGALIRSQPWLSVVATRAVYIIQPNDPNTPLDLIAFVGIGMAEVSTCDITVSSGPVATGDQIGLFHFGGSSYLLIVQPKAGYELVFQDYYETPIRPGQHRWINSIIGQFWPTGKKQ